MPISRLFLAIGLGVASLLFLLMGFTAVSQPASAHPEATAVGATITILVDDFLPQPYPGDPVFFYNRLGGSRGALTNTQLDWGVGRMTATMGSGGWGGVWMSLNHPDIEKVPLNFSAILPTQILSPYQSAITGFSFGIVDGTPGTSLRLELKNKGQVNWSQTVLLTGAPQALHFSLPAITDTTNLNWVMEPASVGDFVVVDRIAFTATMPVTDTAVQAFLWSYGMLLNNWNAETGLVRDQSRVASGEFDGVQSTGVLAAATAVANQLGIVSRADAIQIVSKISNTLLLDIPRFDGDQGLWPHWVTITATDIITIVPGTEWSTVDTAIAAVSLLEGQAALDLDTHEVAAFLSTIDWSPLLLPAGISHGYDYTRTLIPHAWDTFGGESWLLATAYAAATGAVPPLANPQPPTANGSGFIDELAWLFLPPPYPMDVWGADWPDYRPWAADQQINYFPTYYPQSKFAAFGLFGLSAAEVPAPWLVGGDEVYQAFGIGGQFVPTHDGTSLYGVPVVAPHYAAMIASLRPSASTTMWSWLIDQGRFSPLNNVESLMFDAEDQLVWNSLKGSWNLGLQTLGFGRYLAQREGMEPVLWQALRSNSFLFTGYELLVPEVYQAYGPLILKD